MVSGLASSIRAATESASFDLAGLDAASIRSTVKDAFSQPLSLPNMIRITFLVGGGKLSRQKYDDKAMLAVTLTLKQIDYVEDRGASCVNECAGCYKTQHDTGKNLFTVVVFPRLAGSEDGKPNHGGRKNMAGEDEEYEPLIPTNSPGYKMAVCKLPAFKNLLSTYCPTYSENKECLRCLEGLLQVEQSIEGKMMVGQPLDASEQAFYDESSELKEKYEYTQREANNHINEGNLTVEERRALLEMNEKRIATLMAEKSSASVAEKLKKALTRKTQLQALCDEVKSHPPPLRHESKISALRKKLLPLHMLEESSRGRLLTLDETRALTTKGELLEEIYELEEGSRGWFEEDDAFHKRLEISRARARTKRNSEKTLSRAARKEGRSGSVANAVNTWIMPGEKPKSQWGASSGKSKVKSRGGAVFTAMMLDSSSDEQETDEESDGDNDKDVQFLEASKKQHLAASNILVLKTLESSVQKTAPVMPVLEPQAKKKKKKKSKAKPAINKAGTEEVYDTAAKEDAVAEDNDVPSSVSSSLLEFWHFFLMPVLMAIISIILSPVISMLKEENSKTKKKC